jgi:heme-degrading monooxygenase HmoA
VPMISRQWRGLARAERAADYEAHLRADTLPALRGLDGFMGAEVLRREVPEGVEFLVVTRWRSLETIAQFTGRDLEAAVVPEAVRAMMIEYDARVRHYNIVAS